MADKKPFVAKHGIDVGTTTVFGKNSTIHANNAIADKCILPNMMANTMSSSHNLGSTTQIPVIHINDRGQVIAASEVNARTVSGFNYTPANNTLTISTNEGTAFKANLSQSEWDAYMTVANTQALFNSLTANTLSQLANTNAYIASVSATERSALANTNAYIASVDTARNANLANTNAYVASVLTSAQNLAGTRLGANALITLDGDATGSAKFNANSASITVTVTNDSHTHDGRYYTETEVDAFVNDRMQVANTQALHSSVTANLNSYIANTNPRIDNILSSISGTNTAIRALVSSNDTDISNLQTVDGNQWSAITSTNTAIRSLTSANETKIAQVESNLLSTNTSIRSITTTNTNKIAQIESNLLSTNTAIRSYVDSEISDLVSSAPATLDTLNELAAALGDDANFATTVTTNLGQRLGAGATVALGGFITGSNTFSSNATSIDTSLNFNAFTADTLEGTDSIVFWNGTDWGTETVSSIAGGTSGLKGQKGEVGQKGQKGEVGEKGQKGEVGAQGDKGQKGEIGATGDKGQKGEVGAEGATGATGQKGQKGETGSTGATGDTGQKGQKGETGATGAGGAKGEKGQKGQTGATGATGDKGQKGERVSSGSFDDGTNTTTFTNSDTSTFDVVGLKGQKGTTGDTGATGAKGQKGQKGEVGATGDTGATGAKGEKGQKGQTGAAGADGSAGATGQKGQKGEVGAQGATGATGATGSAGQKGQKGQAGTNGTNGTNGAKGQKGEPGATGGTGATGQKGQKGEGGQVTTADITTNSNHYPVFTDTAVGSGNLGTRAANLFFNPNVGYLYANRFYTEDSTGYYIDGNSVSYLHELRIDDLLRDKGDTNTYLNFANDRIQFVAGGVEMMNLVEGTNDYIEFLDNAKLNDDGTFETNGEILAGTSGSYSDIRKKKDLRLIEDATEKLVQLNGYHFNWIESNKPSIGLIAQEVEKIFPELISETTGTKSNDGGTKTLNYSGLIGVLVESIKELDARVKKLESK